MAKLIITIATNRQADKIMAVLHEAEEEGILNFSFNIERQEEPC
jgi:hypothetical protein